jgi:hypothetical protein
MKQSMHTPKSRFSHEEDQFIQNLVEEIGKKWNKIAKKMNNRTGRQIRERYINYLDPSIIQGKFSFEEDEKLMTFLSSNNQISWKEIEIDFPGRTQIHLKNRSKFLLANSQTFQNSEKQVDKNQDCNPTIQFLMKEEDHLSTFLEFENLLDPNLFSLFENKETNKK